MVETAPLNPRAVPGSNEAPDYAVIVTNRLVSEYAGLSNTLTELLDEARNRKKGVESDEEALARGALIKRLRDLDSRIEAVRVLEKEPYLRGGNAADALFNGWRDKIGKRNKNDRSARAGAIDILQAEINVFQDEKAARVRAQLEAERQAAARAAREAEEKAAAEARAAEEARLKADRARKAENIQARAAEAARQEQEAIEAAERARNAAEQAEEARLASLARTADIVRTRGQDASGAGVLLTSAKENFAMLTDRSLVDMNALRPYFTEAEIEKALRGWAKATGYKVQMAGAEIGQRNKGVTK